MNNSPLKIRLSAVGIALLAMFTFASNAFAARSASLFFSPNAGTYNKEFQVNIMISSPDQTTNSVSGSINFPTDKLEAVSISTAGSVADTWITPPTISNTDGVVSFEGLMTGTPFQGTSGKVLTVTFKPKSVGVAVVWFTEAAILANDKDGTNILTGAGSGTYTLNKGLPSPVVVFTQQGETTNTTSQTSSTQQTNATAPNSSSSQQTVTTTPTSASGQTSGQASGQISATNGAPATTSAQAGVLHSAAGQTQSPSKSLPERPVVSSPTHPDQNTAYSNNNPTFQWKITKDITGVKIYADHNPDTQLGETSNGLFTSYTYHNVADGVWYFHIRLRNASGWGNTTHREFIVASSQSPNNAITGTASGVMTTLNPAAGETISGTGTMTQKILYHPAAIYPLNGINNGLQGSSNGNAGSNQGWTGFLQFIVLVMAMIFAFVVYLILSGDIHIIFRKNGRKRKSRKWL